VYPTLPFAVTGDAAAKTGHMRFPGSVTLPPDVYLGVVRAVAQSALAAGFKVVAIMGDHGGGQNELARAAKELDARHRADGARIIFVGDLYAKTDAQFTERLGKRGLPRQRPPFPAQVGLFGRPTLCNNIETLYWVRDIVEKGAEWFTNQGRNGRKGLRTFSVSGRVRDPGVKLAPAGITARQLIDEYCGGMTDGHAFKGYLPGGASGGILPAAMADIPLDFGTLEAHGSFTGSGAVVVLSDKDDMKAVALNLLRFFEDESCGQCTPCRAGTEKAVKLMTAPHWDEDLLGELTRVMSDASICGLGQAAMNPVTQVLKHFREDLL